jgi:hypothetical protein
MLFLAINPLLDGYYSAEKKCARYLQPVVHEMKNRMMKNQPTGG